ncbi:conserved hypothetical protein [Trichinella spiralis]|uniref:hypothetical protein n=1 Tax=Trichinella spiralis TaxID=6334 RepID=UPI0001EFC5A5|nr:conserved hypothetical protein [Trichinella spiralis]
MILNDAVCLIILITRCQQCIGEFWCGSKWIDWKKDSIKSESISSVSATASRLNFYQNGVRRRQKEAAQIRSRFVEKLYK